jgi:2-polyprenyl-3-methyl-5-hydroxy-6-metoxy-1,4-benzoquinol methylase
MSLADKQKWDKRYQIQKSEPPNAPLALIEHFQQLVSGDLLDVACGEGAVALYLNQQAIFNVTAVDVSENALRNLRRFADLQGHKINLLCLDLDDDQALAELDKFHIITLFRFKPSLSLIETLISMLLPMGRLIISTFSRRHHLETGFPEKFCLAQGEFLALALPATVVMYSQSSQVPFTDTYVFEKNSN